MRNYYVALILLIKCINCINYKFTENSFNSEDTNMYLIKTSDQVEVKFVPILKFLFMSKTKYEQDRYIEIKSS